KRITQFTQLFDLWVFSGHLTEGLIGLVEKPTIELRPGPAVTLNIIGKQLFAPMRLTVDDLITTKGLVQLSDQIEPHTLPAIADTREQRPVNRNPATLLLRNRPLKFGAKHCMRQRPDCRDNVRDETRKRPGVVFAIV